MHNFLSTANLHSSSSYPIYKNVSTYHDVHLLSHLDSAGMWPDLAKFCHNGKILIVFGNIFEGVLSNFESNLANVLLSGKFSLLLIAKYWANNLAIWYHWLYSEACSCVCSCKLTRSDHSEAYLCFGFRLAFKVFYYFLKGQYGTLEISISDKGFQICGLDFRSQRHIVLGLG